MKTLAETREAIGLLDQEAMAAAQRRLDSLTKPRGSLGVLEELAVRLAGITGQALPEVKNKVVIVMAGDHGVTEEGVSAYPSEVTAQMVQNFVNGGAAVNVLARQAGARVVVADMGVCAELNFPTVLPWKVRRGTANMARGPAMSREEAVTALERGSTLAEQEIDQGADLIATGDMGIGNTTAGSAILAAFSGLPVAKLTGRGTGVDDRRLRLKVETVERALAVNRPDPRDALDVLTKVGGLEIAGLAGVILGCAARRVPVIIDGFISGAAALVAGKLEPRAREFMIASHLSEEPGHRYMLALLDLKPLLQMRMRLGEGTGAVLAMHLLEAACRIMREMATFDSAGVAGAL
ncbi:nicotinate-nucleotide--dimethylbenzimidazole phosphoribosyltransferase [Gelria sp. Kuro-4]|uniref:nicotinate-nucleotide--dimethylbenzimidazole phosphoribosyltransferase n=1 Tax=Gelria sp. Kuro-4 TaxID=2796927 RepID=UPI001BEF43F2|nr:nicotinate-nucleotide--dimethylbenzimidazole phosphoribosyltransferase [Gelria sp. Kuro-4]BCV23886.1 nicotinate-nucleotide--dimethylbenzimidazole phosphoribosyltransferase [Gelria sp. Kuro-4]